MDQPESELYDTWSNEDGTQLPPRSKARQEKKRKKKEKYKLKYPLISVLSVFFISLPAVAYFSYKHYVTKQETFLMLEEKEEVTGYEVVDFAEPSDTTAVPEEIEKTVEEKQTESSDVKEGTEAAPADDLNENTPVSSEGSPNEKANVEEKGVDGEYQIIQHTVRGNDTLFSIAIQYYHDVKGTQLIREWNKLENGKIKEGQVLKIPLKTEKLPN
ncbi:LysM peptidoglycan-binding domain-containing protein [Priestia abyssalis]|uniref:LysM peptidoglycan-binding domain-containing protein n=1 Tax=Priestia abyssalis TaxID=1221450 RepID=UPI001475A2E6|nr:LysM peptidoglycan-binding domain-containing protein [Priestia abyssalis]